MNQVSMPTGELQRRFYGSGTTSTVDTDQRTCELSFSSTAPVERTFGTEVLSHAPGAADLGRLNRSAPLLFNHDADDILGVVVSAQIIGNKGRAIVRFGRDDRGEWAMHQAADGVLVNVSFSYRVRKYREGADDTLIAELWEALEISLVTVPADKSVGIGRSINLKRKNLMDTNNPLQARPSRRERQRESVELRETEDWTATETERNRIVEIGAMGRRYSLPDQLITDMQRDGTSVADARQRTAIYLQGAGTKLQPAVDFGEEIGMSRSEVSEYSVCRAILAAQNGKWEKAGLEREASRAVAKQLQRESQGFFVPMEVMTRSAWQTQTRATYQTSSGAANLVETSLAADLFTEALRNQSQVIAAGATMLTGLVGNVDIPCRVSPTQTYWVAESGNLTQAEAGFDKIQLRPKTLGALSKMSRLTLMQTTPAIELLTREDMMRQIGLGIDLAALAGTGVANQPLGIINTPGTAFENAGTNGGALTMDHLIQLETRLSHANAPFDTRGYMLNTNSIGTLKKMKSSTGQYIWTTDAPGQRSGTPPTVNGYPLYPTNQLRNTLTKGTAAGICSELIFGAWADLVIGQWGVLEILVNPYDTASFASGDVLVRAFQTVDIGVRHGASFAVMQDALTP